MKTLRTHALPLLLLLALASCTHAPPQLSPEAAQDFHKTQAIRALDALRDTAIAAEANHLLSTADARLVVEYHKSALTVMDAADAGWEPAVEAGLTEALKPLPANARDRLAPFVTLIVSVLHQVQP